MGSFYGGEICQLVSEEETGWRKIRLASLSQRWVDLTAPKYASSGWYVHHCQSCLMISTVRRRSDCTGMMTWWSTGGTPEMMTWWSTGGTPEMMTWWTTGGTTEMMTWWSTGGTPEMMTWWCTAAHLKWWPDGQHGAHLAMRLSVSKKTEVLQWPWTKNRRQHQLAMAILDLTLLNTCTSCTMETVNIVTSFSNTRASCAVEAVKIVACEVHEWTDSLTVGQWISQPTYRWKTFVVNHVSKIWDICKDILVTCNWHTCPGEDNPADFISRGTTVVWLKEPKWIACPSILVDGHEQLVMASVHPGWWTRTAGHGQWNQVLPKVKTEVRTKKQQRINLDKGERRELDWGGSIIYTSSKRTTKTQRWEYLLMLIWEIFF